MTVVRESLDEKTAVDLKARVEALRPMSDRECIERIRTVANHSANALGDSYHALCEIRETIKKHYGWAD